MPNPIGPWDGPVAVTGSAGYIGSHLVLDLVREGYQVRACVRDATNLANTAHLAAMNRTGPGTVTLHSCNMTIPGVYDDVFAGCSAVFHAAAEMGNLQGSTPQKVYDGGLVATEMVIDSIKKAGSVKRLVYTSSFAAVGHPAPEGHVYTEDSWADMNKKSRREGSEWTMDTVAHSREVAYAMTRSKRSDTSTTKQTSSASRRSASARAMSSAHCCRLLTNAPGLGRPVSATCSKATAIHACSGTSSTSATWPAPNASSPNARSTATANATTWSPPTSPG